MEIVINGKACQGQDGQTVLEVARVNGFSIPTLCHIADLTPTGACRLCVVEVDGMRNLVASCSTPAVDGMVVHTNSDRVLEARK
ncbi:MAG: 2Fe-2S iron-sulfur cluster-binding protein, partial [Synergistaceae bacterium]|nr:2Fe-2S iron-sulfur cluster-binding protein [Synergistaceae bacterium]